MALHKPEHKTVKYWLLWPFKASLYVVLLPVALIKGRHDEPKGNGTVGKWNWRWFRDLEDCIDDPIDWLKYKLFGIGELP